MVNTLYYGDNLDILRQKIGDESIDLVYLDPPFNSKRDYNALFRDYSGRTGPARIKAFTDTWHWEGAAGNWENFAELCPVPPAIELMSGFIKTLGKNDVTAYLVMMVPRLYHLHRVLKSTGSLYLHCDPTASHYLKILLDTLFGPKNFRNEIVWRRTGSHNSRRSFGRIHDVLLFYSKSSSYYFEIVRRPYSAKHVKARYTQDRSGNLRFSSGGNVLSGEGTAGGASSLPWRGFDPAAKGRHWAIPKFYEEAMPREYSKLNTVERLEALYQEGLIEIREGAAWPAMVRFLGERDGMPIQDIWAYQPCTGGLLHGTDEGIDEDVAWLGTTDPERLGYDTQKPLGLLERIIRASSRPGDVVLDPFCGCGGALVAAEVLHRQWIGIDATPIAISLTQQHLHDRCGVRDIRLLDPDDQAGRANGFVVEGLPGDLEESEAARNAPWPLGHFS